MGRLFVFMGKSASGKDTLYGELLARYPEIHAVIPYTTRPILVRPSFPAITAMCRLP